MGRRQAGRRRGRGDRGAAGRGPRDHVAAGDREGPRRGVHHRPGGEGRADDHRPQHGAPAHVDGEARSRDGRPGTGEGVMVASPLPALRSEYEEIARRLETVTGGAEREAVKREIIAYFKQVDSLIGELSALKEEVRKLVDRFKQVAASTTEAAAPEFTGTRPAVHADHIGASTFIEKGWSLISLGDYAGAIQALQKALQLSPGETQAESLLGWAQMLHEDYDDALGTFQKVLMKEPANSLARINVGYICLKKRIFGEAIEHLSKAIRLDNDKKATLYAHFYLGLVYLQREMYEDAQTFFQKTLKLGPNLIEAYYELGRAYWFAGAQDQAKHAWEEGFKANKFNPWGKKCQDTLASRSRDRSRRAPRSGLAAAAERTARGRHGGSCDGGGLAVTTGPRRRARPGCGRSGAVPRRGAITRSPHPRHSRSHARHVRLAHPRAAARVERGRRVSRGGHDRAAVRPSVCPPVRRPPP